MADGIRVDSGFGKSAGFVEALFAVDELLEFVVRRLHVATARPRKTSGLTITFAPKVNWLAV